VCVCVCVCVCLCVYIFFKLTFSLHLIKQVPPVNACFVTLTIDSLCLYQFTASWIRILTKRYPFCWTRGKSTIMPVYINITAESGWWHNDIYLPLSLLHAPLNLTWGTLTVCSSWSSFKFPSSDPNLNSDNPRY